MPNNLGEALAELRRAELQWLFVVVAKHLSARKCVIDWCTLRDGIRAEATRRGELAVIHIDRDQVDDLFLTYLHEVAHVAKHWDSLIDLGDLRTAFPEKAVNPSPALAAIRRAAETQREREANDQAMSWALLAGNGSIRDRLKRLLDVRS